MTIEKNTTYNKTNETIQPTMYTVTHQGIAYTSHNLAYAIKHVLERATELIDIEALEGRRRYYQSYIENNL